MSNTRYIALSVGPTGISGCRASSERKGNFEIEEIVRKDWDAVAGPDLSEKVEEIRKVLSDLKNGDRGHMRGVFCVHSSWALVKKVPVPPGERKEVRQYLQLQVDRQRSMLKNKEIAWDQLLAPSRKNGENSEALLIMCGAETIRPVEEAMLDSGVSPAHATVSSLGDYAFIRENPLYMNGAKRVLVKIENHGDSVIEFGNSSLSNFSWMPSRGNSEDGDARFAMLAFNLAERSQRGTDRTVVLTGDPRNFAVARKHLADFKGVEEFNPQGAPEGFSFASGISESDARNMSCELYGLLMQQAASAAARINLIQAAPTHTLLSGLPVLLDKKVTIPVAAALFLLFLAVSVMGYRWETGMYSKLVDKSASITAGVQASQKNLTILMDYKNQRVSTIDVIFAVTEAIPKGIFISKINVGKEGEVQILGICKTHSMVEDITLALKKNPLFKSANTERSSLQKGGVAFRITCKLNKWPGSK